MSTLRKMLAQFRLSDDTVADSASVRVMRSGCRVIASPGSDYILTKNPQGIFQGSYCYAVRNGSKVTSPDSSFQVNNDATGVAWDGVAGAFKISWSNDGTSTYVPAEGDRIVLDESYSANFAEFYDNDVADGTPITAAQTLPNTGKLEGYVKFRDVDLMVTANSTDSYIFDVTTEAREEVTPEDFGATGDGTTDDRQALQNALDYIGYVAGGGALYLGPNTYYCSADNLWNGLDVEVDKTSIFGQGPASVIKWESFSGHATLSAIRVADGVDDFVMRDFTIDYSGATGTPTPDAAQGAIQIGTTSSSSGNKRFVLQNLFIKPRYQTGIAIYGGQGFTISDCVISNGGGACGGHGIFVDDSTTIASKRGVIKGCQMYDNKTVGGNAGIQVDVVDRLSIVGNSIRGWTECINLATGANSQDVVITDNQLRECADDAISMSSAFTVARFVLDGNVVNAAGGRGIYVNTTTTGGVITNNTVTDCTETGISVGGTTTGATIVGNVCRDNNAGNSNSGSEPFILALECGMGLQGVTNSVVVGNTSTSSAANLQNYGFGFGVGFSGNTFSNNHANGNDLGDYYWSASNEATIKGNNVWFTESGGVWQTFGSNIELAGGIVHQYGHMNINSAAATTITNGGTFYKVAGTTTEQQASADIDAGDTTDNRIVYSGSAVKNFHVTVVGAAQLNTAVENMSFALWQYDDDLATGAIVSSSTQVTTPQGVTDETQFALDYVVQLDTDDYIEIHCTRPTSGREITVDYMNVTMREI